MRLIKFLVLAILALPHLAGIAGKNSYQCIVIKEFHLQEDGSLRQYPHPLAIGNRFAVDRATGVLLDGDNIFLVFRDGENRVLANGNSENNFAALYMSKAGSGGVHSSLIHIEEFAPAAIKPFLIMSGTSVYSGTCE